MILQNIDLQHTIKVNKRIFSALFLHFKTSISTYSDVRVHFIYLLCRIGALYHPIVLSARAADEIMK